MQNAGLKSYVWVALDSATAITDNRRQLRLNMQVGCSKPSPHSRWFDMLRPEITLSNLYLHDVSPEQPFMGQTWGTYFSSSSSSAVAAAAAKFLMKERRENNLTL